LRCLLDTNVLLRLLLPNEPLNEVLTATVERLREAGAEICCTGRGLRELWHVCTRQASSNGLELTPAEAGALIEKVSRQCTILYESAASFAEWRRIVEADGIRGAACHDANQAAVARVNSVDRILTLDGSHFRRFKSAGLTVLEPKDITL